MSDEKKYTEREMILARRLASARARCAAFWSLDTQSAHWGHDGSAPCSECTQKAAQRYPLPKVTRPRVVRDPHGIDWLWTVRGGRIAPHNKDRFPGEFGITPERVALWADLLARPTEEVDEA